MVTKKKAPKKEAKEKGFAVFGSSRGSAKTPKPFRVVSDEEEAKKLANVLGGSYKKV